MLTDGQSFGRYLIEGRLGAGGMGVVYRARDTVLGRHVALKVLAPVRGDAVPGTASEQGRARLVREARAAAALTHPHAVAIYDVGDVEGTPYIAMELVSGSSLRAYVGDASLGWEPKLRWLVDAASALAAAHAAGLVHRDVKPENVLVRTDGFVKVLDFGIARRAAASPEGDGAPGTPPTTTLTAPGVVAGTPRYMAPEQIAGRPVDGRADQFSWGVTAYELLSGAPPWPDAGDPMATAAAILTEPPAPLHAAAPGLPGGVVAAIERTLAKDPAGRFASMSDVIEALDPFAAKPSPALSSRPSLVAPPPSTEVDAFALTEAHVTTGSAPGRPAPPAPRPLRRWPWALAAALAAMSAVGAWRGLGVRGEALPPAQPPAPAAASVPEVTRLDRVSVEGGTEATREYGAAMRALHDGRSDDAHRGLARAVEKDPSLGGAQLWLAMVSFFPSPAEPRRHYQKALEQRGALDPNDRALLDALEPVFVRDPPDWAETQRRLAAATEKLPRDAVLPERLAWASTMRGEVDAALAAARRALELDPTSMQARLTQMKALLVSGAWDDVDRIADECLAAVPQAVTCVRERMLGKASQGRCEDYASDARRLIAMGPDAADGYWRQAEASSALHLPMPGVRELVEHAWQRYSPDDRAMQEDNDRLALATLAGDAAGQRAAIEGMRRTGRASTQYYDHLVPAWADVLLQTEAGAVQRAADAAADFLSRVDAWTLDPGLDEVSIALDVRPLMTAALARAGRISRAELERRRDAWVDAWRARLGPANVGYLWIYGHAMLAETPEEAAAAMQARPRFEPISRYRPNLVGDAYVGHTELLAGDLDAAIADLRVAADTCDAFENPFARVQASLWLGQALLSKGDTAGACAAFAEVVSRWGPLGPRSRTLAAARRAMATSCR